MTEQESESRREQAEERDQGERKGRRKGGGEGKKRVRDEKVFTCPCYTHVKDRPAAG